MHRTMLDPVSSMQHVLAHNHATSTHSSLREIENLQVSERTNQLLFEPPLEG